MFGDQDCTFVPLGEIRRAACNRKTKCGAAITLAPIHLHAFMTVSELHIIDEAQGIWGS
jgi:hypothetical protein